jgi:quercetin dioxygenase-like cupin family protein
MQVGQASSVEAKDVAEPGAGGVRLRVLMGQKQGAPNFVMRQFEVAAGGSTPFHTHPWEHEVYVLSGAGRVRRADGEADLRPGTFVYVAPDEPHAFVNAGPDPLTFLCVVPAGHYPGQ